MTSDKNLFSSMIGDVASSLFGGASKGGQQDADKVDAALKQIDSEDKTWSEIRDQLVSQQTTDEERNFRKNLEKGYGIQGSPMHKIRLFDESNKEEDIPVTFYRDSASWCPYCQKVWMALEAKQIPYRVEKINMRCYGDKPASFLKIQPGGQIPVAIINGRVYGQSNDILMALESLPQSKRSLSPPKNMQAEAQQLYGLERQLFSAWMGWLTSGYGKDQCIDTLRYVDSILQKANGPFFLGKEFSLVDIQFASFLERMVASLLYFKGFAIRVAPSDRATAEFPGINAWFDAMEELPAYQLTKSDYYTHAWDLPPQLGGCRSEQGSKSYEDAINGVRSLDGTQGSWELPLQPDNGGIEPDWTFLPGGESAARREAVERLSANHEAIVKFACRGAGSKGFPGFGAPLADPNAIPNEALLGTVDKCLRTISSALLAEKVDDYEAEMKAIANAIVSEGGKDYASGVIASLSYFRDRIGVPRDMRLPAARQLRAHLNWSIGMILDASGK
jgi:glutathione S-transferase